MKIKDGIKPSIPPVPGGTYMAVCVYSIDIGEQLCEYKDKGKSYKNQVILSFELSGMTVEVDGKVEPRILSRTFNIANKENAALRKIISSWNSKAYSSEEFTEVDTDDLVGRPAMISVVLNPTGEYANIDAVMPIPMGFPIPASTAPLIRYNMKPWNQEAFDSLPEWAQARIKKSTQYQKDHPSTETIAAAPMNQTTAYPINPAAGSPQNAQQPVPQAFTAPAASAPQAPQAWPQVFPTGGAPF